MLKLYILGFLVEDKVEIDFVQTGISSIKERNINIKIFGSSVECYF